MRKTNRSTLPPVPAGTMAELETVCPWKAFNCDALGRELPVGHMVRKGMGDPLGVAVTFKAQALAEEGRPGQRVEPDREMVRVVSDSMAGGPKGCGRVWSWVLTRRHWVRGK